MITKLKRTLSTALQNKKQKQPHPTPHKQWEKQQIMNQHIQNYNLGKDISRIHQWDKIILLAKSSYSQDLAAVVKTQKMFSPYVGFLT